MYKVVCEQFHPVQKFEEFIGILYSICDYSSSQVDIVFQLSLIAPEHRIDLPIASKELAERVVQALHDMGAISYLVPISQDEFNWLWKRTSGDAM